MKKKQFNKTHESIKNTYKKLILIKNLPEINATMISLESGISRNTFYLHYNSVNDLTEEIISEIIDDINYSIIELFERSELTFTNIIIKMNYIIETNYIFYMKIFSFMGEFISEEIQNLFIANPVLLEYLLPNNTKQETQTIIYGFTTGLFSMYTFVYKNNINLSVNTISNLGKTLFNSLPES